MSTTAKVRALTLSCCRFTLGELHSTESPWKTKVPSVSLLADQVTLSFLVSALAGASTVA